MPKETRAKKLYISLTPDEEALVERVFEKRLDRGLRLASWGREVVLEYCREAEKAKAVKKSK